MSVTSFSLLYFLRCQRAYAIVFEKKIPKREEKRDTPEGKKHMQDQNGTRVGKCTNLLVICLCPQER